MFRMSRGVKKPPLGTTTGPSRIGLRVANQNAMSVFAKALQRIEIIYIGNSCVHVMRINGVTPADQFSGKGVKRGEPIAI